MDIEETVVVVLYIIIFSTSVIGNSTMMAAVSKNKKLQTPVFILLANMSLSDLLFTIFSLADLAYFLLGMTWVFQDVFCRIQGGMMEVFYTVSMFSLAAIAIERYFSLCKVSVKHAISVDVRRAALVWLAAIAVCSPLFYGYNTTVVVPYQKDSNMSLSTLYGHQSKVYMPDKPNATSKVRCTIDRWPLTSGIIFYCVHTFLAFLLPLLAMIVSHSKITMMIKKKEKTSTIYGNSNFTEAPGDIINQQAEAKKTKARAKNVKIIKLLITITTIFFVIWTPYIVIRLLWHFKIEGPLLLMKFVQLIIFASTAINFFIYIKMNPQLRKTCQSFYPCLPSIKTVREKIRIQPESIQTSTCTVNLRQ